LKALWDGENILLETDQNNIIQVVYTLTPALYGAVVSQRRSGATQYFVFDGIGSTDRLTNAAGTVTDTYLYQAFGPLQAQTGTTANAFRYMGGVGYYLLSDLGRYHVRARDYDPVLGRFLTPDALWLGAARAALSGTMGGVIASPLSARNLYLYVSNRPTILVDPEGLRDAAGGCRISVVRIPCSGYWRHCGIEGSDAQGDFTFHVWYGDCSFHDERQWFMKGGRGCPILLFWYASQDPCTCIRETVHAINLQILWHKYTYAAPPYNSRCGSLPTCNSNSIAKCALRKCGVDVDFSLSGGAPIGWDHRMCQCRAPEVYHSPPTYAGFCVTTCKCSKWELLDSGWCGGSSQTADGAASLCESTARSTDRL
jgi:RHS repeat-associated protein